MTIALEQTMAFNQPLDEDRDHVASFLQGDETAFTTLVNKYRRYIYAIAFRFVGNHQEADDLTQETFLRAYRNIASFRRESSFKTWLCKILTNLAINTKKSKRVASDSGLTPEDLDSAHEPVSLEKMLNEERQQQLHQAISQLPPRQRQTLILRTFRDMSCTEVAEAMGCRTGTVKANLFNAMKNLKTILGAST